VPNKVITKAQFDHKQADHQLRVFTSGVDASLQKLSNNQYVMSGIGQQNRAAGGFISGPGGPTSDSIPARLSNGEYVVNAHATSRHRALLEAINAKGFAAGGMVGTYNGPTLKPDLSSFVNELKGALQAVTAPLGSAGASGPTQQYVRALAASMFGWTGAQWQALKALVQHESGWNSAADNPTSSAHGLFQFLSSTRAAYGIPLSNNAQTQAPAGLSYISDRYGTPAAAWSAWNSRFPHWYGSGLQGGVFNKPTLIGVGERGRERVDVTPLNGGRSAAGDRLYLALDDGTQLAGYVRRQAAPVARHAVDEHDDRLAGAIKRGRR
ncbi:MAG: transglycosylase SLT domain-containing protein, partial [Nocardioidaceae bacterium]